MLGTALLGDVPSQAVRARRLRHLWLDFIERFKLKAFPIVTIAPTARVA